MIDQRNVRGGPLEACCMDPETGFLRDGHCRIIPEDSGVHAVCVEVSEEFLRFSLEAGNDLSTPRAEYGFPGLKAGDRWCLCASRWVEAHRAGVAPGVFLNSTHEAMLKFAPLSLLEEFASD